MSTRTPPPRRRIVGDPLGMTNLTNIDRRMCHRVVPMKVLGMGLSRTGTSSLRQALIDLGFDDCYHFAQLYNENPRDAEMWVDAFERKYEGKGKPFGREEWDQLLGHCMALVDTPCMAFHRELLAAYPDAKVVLLVRDSAAQWHASQMRTIMPFFSKFVLPPRTLGSYLYRLFLPAPTPVERLNSLLPKHYPMYQALAADMQNGTYEGVTYYDDFVAEIKATVPAERLLVLNVKEGWGPLCRFLEVEVPEWEFPKVNSTQEWYENMGAVVAGIDSAVYIRAARTLGAVAVACLGVVGAVWWRSST